MHRALLANGTPLEVVGGRRGARIRGGRHEGHDPEERPAPIETRMATAIAEESGMPNAHKARRQDVEQRRRNSSAGSVMIFWRS